MAPPDVTLRTFDRRPNRHLCKKYFCLCRLGTTAGLSGSGFAMLREVILGDFHQFPLVDGELSR
jgi:hypothetical protein